MQYAQFQAGYSDLNQFFHSDALPMAHISDPNSAPPYGLITHNFGPGVVQYLEITDPYMIMYEFISVSKGRAEMCSYTESECVSQYADFPNANFRGRPLHYHDFYELTLVLSGEVTLQIEDSFYTYHAGEACFCNMRIRHKEFIEGSSVNCEFICLMITKDYLSALMKESRPVPGKDTAENPVSPFLSLLNENPGNEFLNKKIFFDFKTPVSPAPCLDEISHYILTAVTELVGNEPGTSYLVQGALCRVLSLLESKENYHIEKHQLELTDNEKLFFDVSDLFEESHGLISRRELEKKMHYNAEYLNRVIKGISGMTMTKYKTGFIMNEAARLLSETDLPISDICAQLGYSNRTYFNRIFSDRYHMTPNEYRKSARR